MRLMHVFFACLVCFPAGIAAGQNQGQAKEPPWPVILGLRVAAVEASRPVASVVVLVPDADTFIREIGRWSPEAQWPVLIEDSTLTPCFIRAFKPRRIIRIPRGEPLPKNAEKRRAFMNQVVVDAWGGEEGESLAEVFARLNWKPPGMVVTAVDDSASVAAVALASGRGLPLAFLPGKFGSVNGVLSADATRTLNTEVEKLAEATGYEWKEPGDDIDAVAFCRTLAARTDLKPPPDRQHPLAGRFDGPLALTDSLCRKPNGDRWGFAGWIWGNDVRAAYMAMSSLFVPRNSIWFFNAYEDEGGREPFKVEGASRTARDRGYEVLQFTGNQADERSWLQLIMGGLQADVLMMNSSGMPGYLDLNLKTRAYPRDVPILQKPLALHLIHSYSLQIPASINSVGGRFLDRGVYAYVGSVHEPFLTAFQPPELLVQRMSSYTPFLISGRAWIGPGSEPWRLTTIGDPLMLIQPPGRRKIKLGEMPEPEGAEDLLVRAQDQLKQFKEDPSNALEVINALVLIGRDDIAAKIWEVLQQQGLVVEQTESAYAVMGALYRMRLFNAFIDAYQRLPMAARGGDVQDMLWHLATPRLNMMRKPEVLALLLASIRQPNPDADLRRLLPHVDRVLGEGSGRKAITEAIESARNEATRKALRGLLSR